MLVHQLEEDDEYLCPLCPKKCDTVQLFQVHWQSHGHGMFPNTRCLECGRPFHGEPEDVHCDMHRENKHKNEYYGCKSHPEVRERTKQLFMKEALRVMRNKYSSRFHRNRIYSRLTVDFGNSINNNVKTSIIGSVASYLPWIIKDSTKEYSVDEEEFGLKVME